MVPPAQPAHDHLSKAIGETARYWIRLSLTYCQRQRLIHAVHPARQRYDPQVGVADPGRGAITVTESRPKIMTKFGILTGLVAVIGSTGFAAPPGPSRWAGGLVTGSS